MSKRDVGADFSPSGRALIQLARNSRNMTVRIVPIEADGTFWEEPATIDIVEDTDQGHLASIDVGPPITTVPGTRLVVMSFINQTEGDKSSAIFKKLVVYSITRPGPAKKWPTDYFFSDQTRQVSEVSFDPSGENAAIAAVEFPSNGGPKSTVIKLKMKNLIIKNDDDFRDPKPTDAKTDGKSHVVTAVAYAEMPVAVPSDTKTLITGRLDGSVYCEGTRIDNPDTSPVTRLRVAGQGPWFAALHASNNLVIGKCGKSVNSPQIIKENLSTLQSLMLRSITNKGAEDAASTMEKPNVQLSFTNSRSLHRITWPKSSVLNATSIKKFDETINSEIDQAIPVFASTVKGAGEFLTLPDRSRPWIVMLDSYSPSGESNVSNVGGLPVGFMPHIDDRQLVNATPLTGSLAASPNQLHRARIMVKNNATLVERQMNNGNFKIVGSGGDGPPIAVTLNNRGVLAILENGRKIALVQPVVTEAVRSVLNFDGACLKLTPDGNHGLVAGKRGEVAVVDLNPGSSGKKVTTVAGNMQPVGSGAPLTACAVSNKLATVLGFQDGKVFYSAPKGTTVELSALAQFRLSSEVQDVSIDTTERFVAVVGKWGLGVCLGGKSGYPIRIWDLGQKRVTFPVASWCLANVKVAEIGPIQNDSGKWLLPIYLESDKSAQILKRACLACDGTANSVSLVKTAEKKFEAMRLEKKQIKDKYGIEH